MKIALTIAVLLAALRIYFGFTVPPESPALVDLFKDMSHVFIGGLAVLWWKAIYPGRLPNHTAVKENELDRIAYSLMFWGLNFLEITVAVLTRI